MGTPAALAWLMASMVCGRTPSSAATTMTATSVTFVPRARMALNACSGGVRVWISYGFGVEFKRSTSALLGDDILGQAHRYDVAVLNATWLHQDHDMFKHTSCPGVSRKVICFVSSSCGT